MGNTRERLLCGNCFTYNDTNRRSCRKCGERLHSGEKTRTYGSEGAVPCSETGPFSPGDTVAGRYDVIEEIGRGGMGCVYKVRDRHLNITVALKIIRPERSKNPEIVGFFKDETLLARSITHENVLRIYDIGEHQGLKYISMDYIK